ncbi:MAG TPA: glycosyltransferase family 9 protein [Candidatus Kapabacteria bacterium]|nr:glycosyltransferase family 9 protein [Candidatus Kapabacteria bacterium]
MLKLNKYKKILITQTAFIGDVVLTIPLIAKIKELSPNSQLHVLTTKVSSQIISLLKDVDGIIVYDKKGADKSLKGFLSIISKIRAEKYDLIISPHRSLRTSLMNFFSKANTTISFNTADFALLYSHKIKYNYSLHEIDRNLSLLSQFEEYQNNKSNQQISLYFNENIQSNINTLLSNNNIDKYIVIAPGSVWATKRWLPQHFTHLIKLILNTNYKVILTGSKDDSQICRSIMQASNNDKVIDTSGQLTINETIYLISKATMIVTNDSAPIHFAGLVKTKTIAIFGPTIPEFGFAPRGTNDVVMQINGLKCRPCAIHGSNKCPIGTHECMAMITPNEVFSKMNL